MNTNNDVIAMRGRSKFGHRLALSMTENQKWKRPAFPVYVPFFLQTALMADSIAELLRAPNLDRILSTTSLD